MRLLLTLVLLTATAWGQRGGGMRGGGGGMRGGGSFHGGGAGWRGGGFAGGGTAWRGGHGFYGGARFGYGHFGGYYARAPYYRGAYYGGPWGYYGGFYGYSPWVYGGYGYISSPYTYGQSYPATPNITVVTVPAPEYSQAPSIIVNDAIERPRSDERPPSESAAPRPDLRKPILYLIASKSGTIWPSVAYWVEGSTLHFVTRLHERKQLPLDQIDRDLSLELNRERRVDFRLP